jgi:hypothetical protein
MRRDPDRRLLLAGLGITGAAALVRVGRARSAPPPSAGTTPRDIFDKIARTDQGFGEARIPLASLAGSATAQYVIDAPGVYYMTANVVGVAGKVAVDIQADHVELECDGFTFVGAPGTLACIIASGSRRCIGVYDAGFKAWQNTCIDLAAAADSCVEECWFDSCDSTTNSAARGTCALGPGGVVFDCDVRSCRGALVSVGPHGVIEECTNFNGDGGCFFAAADAVMEDNFAMDNSGAGFTIQTRGVLIGNRLLKVGGLHVGAGSVVSENDIGDAPGAAITVHGARCCVEENYIANARVGIVVIGGAGETLVDGNQIVGAQSGVAIDDKAPGCFVVRNCVRGIAGAAAYTIPPGSSYGPIVQVAGTGDISAVVGADHPWANFSY